MRGKVSSKRPDGHIRGITPAYAGKSLVEVALLLILVDHPRVCGEKPVSRTLNVDQKGSPPRMRGKAQGALDGTEVDRITPAYAGKSRFSLITKLLAWDHPRVCGEKTEKE